MKVLKLLKAGNLKVVRMMEKAGTAVETILARSLLSKSLNWRNIFFYWLLAFLLIYHAEGQWENSPAWDIAYYLWHSTLITIAILGFFQYEPETIKTFYPILFYSILRTCCYILVLIIGIDMNAKLIVETVFIVALVATIYITINQSK